MINIHFKYLSNSGQQGLSQDLETGCPKLSVVKFWGVHVSKGNHSILINCNHKHVFNYSNKV